MASAVIISSNRHVTHVPINLWQD